MSPAPTETANQKTGVQVSSHGLKSLGTCSSVCLSNPKPMEQTNLFKGNSSIVFHTGSECFLQKSSQSDCSSLPPYKSHFLLSNSILNVHKKDSVRSKIGKDNCRQRTDTRPLFAEKRVKRELFPGTVSQVLADVNKLWDLSVIEAEGMHGSPGPKYRLNGRIEGKCLSIPLASNHSSTDLTDLEKKPQTLQNKETKAKSSLMRCLNQQRVLIKRAERNKKRLQMLLTNHVAEHCRKGISDFVSFQTKKASSSHLRDDTRINHNAADPINVSSNKLSDQKKNCERLGSPSRFSESMPGILTSLERQFDSDVTGSSSDEDWNEKSERLCNCKAKWNWLSTRANVGSRWTWLQAKVSELENKIQQLGSLQSQLRSQKAILVFKELSDSILQKETHLPVSGKYFRPVERQASPQKDTKDLEMSPSSPTMLLRNIEKQSAQLTEMVSNLMSFPSPLPRKPYNKTHNCEYGEAGFPNVNRIPMPKMERLVFNGFGHTQPKKERIHPKVSSIFGSSSARTRPLQSYHKRTLYRYDAECTAMLSHKAVYCCNESLQTSNHGSTWTCTDKLQRPKSNVYEIEPGFHHVLSLSSDVPLGLYLQALLKNNRSIRDDAVENSLLKQKEDGYHPPYTHNSSSISITPESLCDLYTEERSSARAPDSDTMTITSSNASQADDTSITPTSHKTSSQTHDPSFVLIGTRRRPQSQSSYDIDNIVIPMNLVAPLKLEKIQYKEIITPSFKEMVYKPLESPPNEEELEDLSDDTYSHRHEKYEQREKARWSFWQRNSWPKRSRSSSHSFAISSEKMFPSHEEEYSPGNMSPVSCDTPSLKINEPQIRRLSDELGLDKWEQRVFPLTEEDTQALVNANKSVQHANLLTNVENGQQQL